MKPEHFDAFAGYFTKKPQKICDDKIISDESLFRDYSRFGERKVDFNRVRNPFTLAKYAISNYDKTWFMKTQRPKQVSALTLLNRGAVKNSETDVSIEGPFSSYEMDRKFKSKELVLTDKVGISPQEFFDFKYLIDILYPLPKIRNFDGMSIKSRLGETQSTMGGRSQPLSDYFRSAKKFNRIYDDSAKSSFGFSEGGSSFKRTPFKNILGEMLEDTPGPSGFVEVNDNQLRSAQKQKNVLNANEHFVIKSWKKGPQMQMSRYRSAQVANKQRRVFKKNYSDSKPDVARKMDFGKMKDPVQKRISFIKEVKEEEDVESVHSDAITEETLKSATEEEELAEGSVASNLSDDDDDSFDFEVKAEDQ